MMMKIMMSINFSATKFLQPSWPPPGCFQTCNSPRSAPVGAGDPGEFLPALLHYRHSVLSLLTGHNDPPKHCRLPSTLLSGPGTR